MKNFERMSSELEMINERFPLFDFSDAVYRNVLLRITNSCNAGCNYCYVGSDKFYKKNLISMEVIGRVMEEYNKNISSYPEEKRLIYFLWHGGEPLTAGLDFFKKAMEIEREYKSKGFRIYNGLQTNGTLLNQEWVDFFKENDFSVGVSVDGPRHVYDIHRSYKSGRSMFDDALRGLRLLQENGIPVSVISVVTNKNYLYWEDILTFFMGLGVDYVDYIPCFFNNRREYLSPENWEHFIINTFYKWIELGGMKRLKIRLFNDFMNKVSNSLGAYTTVSCHMMGRCGEMFSIAANGDVYPCECLPPSRNLRLGNIIEGGLDEAINSANYEAFKQFANTISKECFECSVFAICRGGCGNRRYTLPPGVENNHRDYYCQAIKKLIYHMYVLIKTAEKAGKEVK